MGNSSAIFALALRILLVDLDAGLGSLEARFQALNVRGRASSLAPWPDLAFRSSIAFCSSFGLAIGAGLLDRVLGIVELLGVRHLIERLPLGQRGLHIAEAALLVLVLAVVILHEHPDDADEHQDRTRRAKTMSRRI